MDLIADFIGFYSFNYYLSLLWTSIFTYVGIFGAGSARYGVFGIEHLVGYLVLDDFVFCWEHQTYI